MSWFDKVVMWLTGSEQEAREALERQGTTASIENPGTVQGQQADHADGRVSGGVVWPLERGTHGMVGFLTSPVFYAHYDAKAKRCYMLDKETGERHRGAKPLILDDNVFVVTGKKRSGRGTVIRTALLGEDGIYRNIFRHDTADLIAHHVQPDPPENSSDVYDPDGDSDRAGGLHYPLRVREWVRVFCQKYFDRAGKLFAPLFNLGRNGDGTPAYGAAHWDRDEGVLSDEAGGPLATADDGFHVLAVTSEANINQGGNDIDVLYGPVSGLYMPEEIVTVQWEPGSKGPFVMRVEKRPDFNAKHKNHCGQDALGVIKWQSWDMFREYPPTIKEPEPKKKQPEVEPKYPVCIVPPEGIPPTAATPNETESPSHYGHPAPAIPDGEPARGTSDDPGTNAPEAPNEPFWNNRYGFNERAWNEFSNVCSHEFALPVYASDSRGTGPNPWPTVNRHREGLLQFDAQGNIIGRDANIGDGTVIDAPAWSKPWHALSALHGADWLESQHARVVLAGKNSDGVTIDGRLGIGARKLTSPFVVSGQEFRLGYDGVIGASEPDLHLYPKAVGGTDGIDVGAAAFVIHEDVHITGNLTVDGTSPGGGSGDVVGPGSATDNAIARFDTTTGKLIQNSGVIVDDPATSTIRIHTGAAAHILLTPDTSLSSGTFDTTVDAGATGSTNLNLGTVGANATNIGRSGRTTTVSGLASLAGQAKLSINTPSQITSNQTGYTGLNTGVVQRASTDASRTINTIAAPATAAGGFIVVINVGSYNLVFKNDDGATGTAADRIVTGLGTDYTLPPAGTAQLMYDTTSSRWRILA